MSLAGDGWRARIGIVIPGTNTTLEPWYSRIMPEGVTVHTARMFLQPVVSVEAVREMDRDGMKAVRDVASCGLDSLAYICTVTSIINGPEYDAELIGQIQTDTGVPATTVTASILEGLKLFGVNRVVIASPYTAEIDEAERAFFEKAGVEVLHTHGMGIRGSVELAKPEPGEIYRFAKESWDPRAEALLITCGALRSHYVTEALENDLGCPVITSTQAPIWKALRLAGIKDQIPGFGKLMRL